MKIIKCRGTLRIWAVLTALLMMSTLPLGAYYGDSNTAIGTSVLSLGPRAVYYTAKDADKGQWGVGMQARFHLNPALGLELSADYLKSDFGTTSIKTMPVQASLFAYIFPLGAISPYILAGGGWYNTKVEGTGFDSSSTRFGPHAGIGFELMLNDYLAFDASYRYIWLEAFKTKDASALDVSYQDSGSMVTIALNYLFGNKNR